MPSSYLTRNKLPPEHDDAEVQGQEWSRREETGRLCNVRGERDSSDKLEGAPEESEPMLTVDVFSEAATQEPADPTAEQCRRGGD